MEKLEFESRISFETIKMRSKKAPVIGASVYWNGKLYETIKANKELAIEDLKKKVGLK